jgi:hypothetical protein
MSVLLIMVIKTTIYYFTNDLFRIRGQRITIKDLDEIGAQYSTKITAQSDKIGPPGAISKMLLKNLGVDVMNIAIEGENEALVRDSIKAIFDRYGPYETIRGKEGELAKNMQKELLK